MAIISPPSITQHIFFYVYIKIILLYNVTGSFSFSMAYWIHGHLWLGQIETTITASLVSELEMHTINNQLHREQRERQHMILMVYLHLTSCHLYESEKKKVNGRSVSVWVYNNDTLLFLCGVNSPSCSVLDTCWWELARQRWAATPALGLKGLA